MSDNAKNKLTKNKHTRSRKGCWTCKARYVEIYWYTRDLMTNLKSSKRKCDETRPVCQNCSKSGRRCLGYDTLLAFDVDDKDGGSSSRNSKTTIGFRGRPKLKDSLAARGINLFEQAKRGRTQTNFILVHSEDIRKKYKLTEAADGDETNHPCTEVSQPKGQLVSTTASSIEPQTTQSVPVSNIDVPTQLSAVFSQATDKIVEICTPIEHQPPSFAASPKIHLGPPEFDWTEIPFGFDDIANELVKNDDYMIKHFMEKLIPLFDNLENSPFPLLVTKYCNPELAKNCFIALSSVHMYEMDNNLDAYEKSIEQLTFLTNKLMELLFVDDQVPADDLSNGQTNFTSADSTTLIVEKLKLIEPFEARSSKVITILILTYVHTMFCILESGKSSVSEFLFKLSSRIAYEESFRYIFLSDHNTKFLIGLLGWFETFTALSSPNIRWSYIRQYWFEGQETLRIATDDITGCPQAVFDCFLDIIDLRHDIFHFGLTAEYNEKKMDITRRLESYRDYIKYDDERGGKNFHEVLLGAQGWSVGGLLYLTKLLPPKHQFRNQVTALQKEFKMLYEQFDRNSETRKQMIWPLFLVGELATIEEDRKWVTDQLKYINKQNGMGNMRTLVELLEKHWSEGGTMDMILSGDSWLKSGVTLLPM